MPTGNLIFCIFAEFEENLENKICPDVEDDDSLGKLFLYIF